MACSTARVSSVWARRKPPPPNPRSLRIPTRLTTTSLPRKCSLSCASSYTSPFSSVRPGSTNRCLCCSRSRQGRDAVTVLDQARDEAGSEEPGAAQYADRQGLHAVIFAGSSYGNQEHRRSAPHVEHQYVGTLRRLAKTLGVRYGGAADTDDQVVR